MNHKPTAFRYVGTVRGPLAGERSTVFYCCCEVWYGNRRWVYEGHAPSYLAAWEWIEKCAETAQS